MLLRGAGVVLRFLQAGAACVAQGAGLVVKQAGGAGPAGDIPAVALVELAEGDVHLVARGVALHPVDDVQAAQGLQALAVDGLGVGGIVIQLQPQGPLGHEAVGRGRPVEICPRQPIIMVASEALVEIGVPTGPSGAAALHEAPAKGLQIGKQVFHHAHAVVIIVHETANAPDPVGRHAAGIGHIHHLLQLRQVPGGGVRQGERLILHPFRFQLFPFRHTVSSVPCRDSPRRFFVPLPRGGSRAKPV